MTRPPAPRRRSPPLPLALALAVPAAARREDDDHDERLDLGRPARRASSPKGFLKTNRGRRPQFRLLQGGSDIGINDVARGRVTIGMSSRDPQPSDPGGLVFNRIARDGVCIVTQPRQPLANLTQATGAGDLLRPDPQLERRAGREEVRPDRPGHPHPRLRYRGRVPEHLHGPEPARRGRREPEAVERPRRSRRSRSNPSAIGYVDFKFTGGTASVPYQGVAVQPAQREVRASTRASRNFWLVTPRQARPAPPRSSCAGSQRSERARASSPTAGSPCASAGGDRAQPRRDRRSGAPWAPAVVPGPSRTGTRARCSVLVAAHGARALRRDVRVRLRQGVAVVLGNGLRLVRRRPGRPAARRTSSSRRRTRTTTCCEIGALPAAVRHVHHTAGAVVMGLVVRVFTAIFIVEFAPAAAAVASSSRSSGCSRRSRRSIYGLIGILVLVPFVGDTFITECAQGVGRLRRPADRREPGRRGRRSSP